MPEKGGQNWTISKNRMGKEKCAVTFGKATRLQRVFLNSPSESSVASLRFSKEIRSSLLMMVVW